jgi:hypothetical protein
VATILYLLRSAKCPDFGPDTEAIVVADEDSPPPEGGVDAYACLTTLVTNYDDSPAFRQSVAAWWKELSGAEPLLEVLATEPMLMSPDQRDSIAELEPSSWSARSNVVLFPRDSDELEAEARRIIVEAALNAQ